MTIFSSPANYSSAQDDLLYVVYDAHSSNPLTFPNYKYIADVYVNNILVARLKRVQDPVNAFGVFDIGSVVRNYLATTFDPTPSILVSQILGLSKFFVNVEVHFGEEYLFTHYLDEVVSASLPVFNNYNGRLVGATSSLTAVTDKLATNNVLAGSLLLSTSFYFVPYFPTTTTAVNVTVTPTGGGSSFSTTINPNANEMQVLNLSPVVMNAIHPGAITAATTSYTVQVGSQTYTIKLICEAQYDVYAVHFLNQYGGFETKLFNKVSRTSYPISRKDFGKLSYIIDDFGIPYYKNTHGVYNENRSVYSVQFTEKLVLNSDLLTDAEYQWLRDLMLSPMVYIQDGAYFFPVTITDSNYEPKKAINDDLTNLTISVEYGQNLNAQYR